MALKGVACIDDAVNAYFIDLKSPADGLRCKDSELPGRSPGSESTYHPAQRVVRSPKHVRNSAFLGSGASRTIG